MKIVKNPFLRKNNETGPRDKTTKARSMKLWHIVDAYLEYHWAEFRYDWSRDLAAILNLIFENALFTGDFICHTAWGYAFKFRSLIDQYLLLKTLKEFLKSE